MTLVRFANPLLQPATRPTPRHIGVIGAGAIGPDIAYYLKSALPQLKLTLIDVRQAARLQLAAELSEVDNEAASAVVEALRSGDGARCVEFGGAVLDDVQALAVAA